MNREPVEGSKRLAMTPARKRRIWSLRKGLCKCGVSVPIMGPGVIYDHDLPLWFGRRADLDSEVWPRCTTCDKAKTARDQGRIAKTKRQQKMGGPRSPSKLKSARKIQGHGFRKDIRKRMDGTVEPRT